MSFTVSFHFCDHFHFQGHKKLLKFSDEDLLKVVEHLSQRCDIVVYSPVDYCLFLGSIKIENPLTNPNS